MGHIERPCAEGQRRIAFHVGLVAEELHLLHVGMERLQETLVAVVAGSPAAHARHCEFQDIDRMTQTVGQLAIFLATMAEAVSRGGGDMSAALSQVSLGALQCRLAGSASQAVLDPGAIDLF